MKIIILILSSDTYPSKRNKKIIQKTWGCSQNKNLDIYFYKAGNETYLSKDNEIIVKSGKTSIEISKKNIEAFEYVFKNFKFDYLFRTTTTSYVNPDLLMKFIKSEVQNEEFVYSGKVMQTNDHSGNSVNFVSGAGILFNNKVIEKILDNKSKVNYDLWDDVGIGKLISELNIKPIEGFQYEIKGNIFKEKLNVNHYHYRCRIDNHYGYPRFLEKYVISYLHKFINKIEISKSKILFWNLIFEISKIIYVQYPFLKLFNFLKSFIKLLIPKIFMKNFYKKYKKINEKINLRYFKY